MARPTTSDLFVACLALAICSSPAKALDDEDLYGLWHTPGGNIVEIQLNEQKKLEGILVYVTSINRNEYGYRPGQLVMKNFTLGDKDDIKMDIAARAPRANSPSENPCLPDWLSYSGDLSSGQSISGTVISPSFDIVTTGRCEKVGENVFQIPPYRRFKFADIELLEDRQIFRAERYGEKDLTLDTTFDHPQGIVDRRGAPSIKVFMIDGQIAAAAEVVWHVQSATEGGPVEPVTYVTETNQDGIAKLKFTLLPDGRFAPTNQLRQETDPATIPRGRWIVRATVPELGIAEAISYSLTIDGPGALVNFLDHSGRIASELIIPVAEVGNDQKIKFRVRDFTSSDAQEIKVYFESYALDFPRNPGSPTLSAATATSSTFCVVPRSPSLSGIYSSNPPLTLTFGPSVRNCHLRLPRTTGAIRVVAKINAPRLVTRNLRIFLGATVATDKKLRAYFKDAHEKLLYFKNPAQTAPADQMKLIDQKIGYIKRAFLLLNEPYGPGSVLNNRVQVYAANAYIELLKDNKFQPERPRRVSLYNGFGRDDTARYIFNVLTTPEFNRLKQASLMAVQTHDWSGGRDHLLKSIPTLGQLSVAIDLLVALPFETAYIIAVGETWAGQRRDTVDRLFLGLNIASFRIFTPKWLDEISDLIQRSKSTRRARQRVKEARKANIEISMRDAFDANRYRRSMRRAQRRMTAAEARQIQERLDELLLKPAWQMADVPADLKKQLRYVMTRLAHMRQSQGLVRALERLEEKVLRSPHLVNSARGRLATRIGLIQHWLKYQNELAYMQSLVRAGKAREVRRGQHFISADGKTEIFIEYKIGGKRVDYAIASHFDDRIELNIVDLTGQLLSKNISHPRITPGVPRRPRPILTEAQRQIRRDARKSQHLEKTTKYGTLFLEKLAKKYPDKALVVRATELYWRENNVAGALDKLVRTFSILK